MEQGQFLSSDGKNTVAYYIYENKEVKPKAVLQISHGMQEHITRYTHFAEFLNSFDKHYKQLSNLICF